VDSSDSGGLHIYNALADIAISIVILLAIHEFHCHWQIQLHSHWYSQNLMLVHNYAINKDSGIQGFIKPTYFGPSVCLRHRRLSDTMVPLKSLTFWSECR
jgi:hypothetical protein